jgi:hypothetical protein
MPSSSTTTTTPSLVDELQTQLAQQQGLLETQQAELLQLASTLYALVAYVGTYAEDDGDVVSNVTVLEQLDALVRIMNDSSLEMAWEARVPGRCPGIGTYNLWTESVVRSGVCARQHESLAP